MRVSVIVATSNRGASLRVLLEALRHQIFSDFEVVVVAGPSADETDEVLEWWGDRIRVVRNPERNLSVSRNLGLDVAAGELVAFIDDDAVPEPRWLADLVAGFTGPRVGAVGGLVYDASGVNFQYRFAACDRVGRTRFDVQPPFDELTRPGADPALYLQGTNMCFRRQALEDVGGFDENIEYVWDDVDIAIELLDAEWGVVPLAAAPVHHKVLPSPVRRGRGEVTDPYVAVKNRSYFAFRCGFGPRSAYEVMQSVTSYTDELRAHVDAMLEQGRFSAREHRLFVERLEAGVDAGVREGLSRPRAGRRLAPMRPDRFAPYPCIPSPPDRLRLCFVSVDYPPLPMGGIARYTVDLARGLAALGHEIHVVTRAEGPYCLEFEQGVWVHRYPGGNRLLPSLDGHPAQGNLAHVARVWRAVDDVARRFPLDIVIGNAWLAEPLACSFDPRWPVIVSLATPVRTIASTQPAVAARPETEWQVELEDAALAAADQLHALSHVHLEFMNKHAGEGFAAPADVVWLGMVDRESNPSPPPARDDVEILFVGRLEPRKGVDTLLEAASQVLAERPRARLRVVGADNPYAWDDARPYADRARERLASRPDVLGRITFEGGVPEAALDDRFRGCDIFCAPSRYESFGLMNLEAMMFSRPVVSTRVGGIQEVVLDGETGVLVPPDDVDALADALRRLIDDPELRRQLGAAGRARFEREFANEIAARRMEDLIRRTIARVPPDGIPQVRAEAEVRRRLEELISHLGGVSAPGQAVAELLDPLAFPEDYLASLAPLESVGDRAFVEGVYQVLLRRDPDSASLAEWLRALREGLTREELVIHVARSEEARALNIPQEVVRRFDWPRAEIVERLQRALLLDDDEQCLAAMAEVLVPPHIPQSVVVEALRPSVVGGERLEALAALVCREDVVARYPAAPDLLHETFLTPAAVERQVGDLVTQDAGAMIAGLYEVLLGRQPEPESLAGWVELDRVSRLDVLGGIAGSEEAAARGITPALVERLATTVPASANVSSDSSLASPRARHVPGLRRARNLARRVLRDPNLAVIGQEVSALRAALDGHTTYSRGVAEDLTTRTMRLQSSVNEELSRNMPRTDQLAAEVRSAAEQLVGLPTQVADQLAAKVRTAAEQLVGLSTQVAAMSDQVSSLPTSSASSGSFATYLGDGKVLVAMQWGAPLLTPACDRSLTPELVTRGIYEAPFSRYLIRTLQPGQTVIDVGANIGMYTVLMGHWVTATGRVVAYEPSPNVLDYLRDNVALNYLTDRVLIRPVAAAEAAGRLPMHVSERFMGNSSLLDPGGSATPTDAVHTLEIETEPLDVQLRELAHADLVKIDVEGAETQVIAGMWNSLMGGLVDRVAFEVFRDRAGAGWGDFADQLRRLDADGWRYHDISEDGELIALGVETLLERGRFSQVVALRPGLD